MFRLAYGLLLLFLAVKFITQASDSSPINPRGESNSHDCSTRTLFSIIWGCVSTTIICAWAALHPNIPPREGPVKGALRRVELMFWTIMAPEILPTLALNQLLGAMTVRDMYNKAKGYKEDGMGKRWFWWYQIKSWFSFDEREESTSQLWTVRHGQFLIMGGIHLVEPPEATRLETESADAYPTASTPLVAETPDVEKGPVPLVAKMEKGRVTILTLEMLRELVKDPSFEIQITEDEISDRSKGDGLSKVIFILQTSWFIVQCIARHIQGLDLTQLELTTLAMASLNGITCMLWWHKPLNAQGIVRVYLTRPLTDEERNAAGRDQSSRSGFFEFYTTSDICAPWLFRIIAFPFFLMFVILATVFDVVGINSTAFPVDATHVSTFYHPRHRYNQSTAQDAFFLLALASVFGGIHCAGWNFSFPSYTQRMLWHVASLAVTILPLVAIPISVSVAIIINSCIRDDEAFNIIAGVVTAAIALMYAVARLILLGQAIGLLRHLPPNALMAVNWAQFYPHFF